MSLTSLPKSLNQTQERFAELCKLGGGAAGGPARGPVLKLLGESGRHLNETVAYPEVEHSLKRHPAENPWHVCFAIGMAWGHLASLEDGFVDAAIGALKHWNSADVNEAKSYHLDRGPTPLEQSLIGGHNLFQQVTLPPELPSDVRKLSRAQERWLSPIISPNRPKYIGSWNSTAMFLVALFAQPALAQTLRDRTLVLPPGGPVYNALHLLHRAKIISRKPEGSELDDGDFEAGALYANSALMAELCQMDPTLTMVDVHSALYMLGTRDPGSKKFDP